MKFVLGLGNPGPEYINTRHNVGLACVDVLADRLKSAYGWRREGRAMVFKNPEWVLVKTADVFMNESGSLLSTFSSFNTFNKDNLYVVHDDLDIKLGEFKIQKGKGPKVHGGVMDVERAMGTADFWRVRIGIDNRMSNIEYRMLGEKYVLEKFGEEEKNILKGAVDAAVEAIIAK
jgi:PTH1 family peptidyl-tRNA hydrolase